MTGIAEHRTQRQARRHRQAVDPVALAIARDRRVDGEREAVKARRLAAGDEFGGEAAILEDVDLEDLRPAKRLGEIAPPRGRRRVRRRRGTSG